MEREILNVVGILGIVYFILILFFYGVDIVLSKNDKKSHLEDLIDQISKRRK